MSKKNASLQELAISFAKTFPHPVPPLFSLLSTISSSHRTFATLVPTPEHLELFRKVLIWLLKRDLLVMLHVRVRIFATEAIKHAVAIKKQQKAVERHLKRGRERRYNTHDGDSTEQLRVVRGRDFGRDSPGYEEPDVDLVNNEEEEHSDEEDEDEGDVDHSDEEGSEAESDSIDISFEDAPHKGQWDISSPPSEGRDGQLRSHSNASSQHLEQSSRSFESGSGSAEIHVSEGDELDGSFSSSLIENPAQANPLQKRWLAEMTLDKSEAVVSLWKK